jgi:hypothetical protein
MMTSAALSQRASAAVVAELMTRRRFDAAKQILRQSKWKLTTSGRWPSIISQRPHRGHAHAGRDWRRRVVLSSS